MKISKNTKAAIAANKTAHKVSKAVKRATSENVHEVEIADFVDTTAYDAMKTNALTAYATGRDSSYRAMALAYMWYELAKHDKTYIADTFDKMRTKTLLNNYSNTVKCCFNINSISQASTITKYARVLGYINKHSDVVIDEQTDNDDVAKKIAKLIVDGGGLDACANAYSASAGGKAMKKSSKARMTAEDVSRAMKKYKNKRKALGSFKVEKHLEGRSGELVVMIGRIDTDTMNVVDIITNSDVIEHVIRKQ